MIQGMIERVFEAAAPAPPTRVAAKAVSFAVPVAMRRKLRSPVKAARLRPRAAKVELFWRTKLLVMIPATPLAPEAAPRK